MKNRKRLNEGTSNFWSMDYFPLLVFDKYEDVDEMAREYAIGELSEEELDELQTYDFEYDYPRFQELVDEYFDKYPCAVLDEEEFDSLKDDMDNFNRSMKNKYWYDSDWNPDGVRALDGENWEEYGVYPSVTIRYGYYEAVQLYVNVEPKEDMIQNYKFFTQEQIDEVNAFLRKMQNKYGLTEHGVSYRASNGETGYHKMESLNTIRSIAKILKESPMSADDRRDSNLLNSIVSKRGKNLSKEEQDILDKYGVDYSDGLGAFKERGGNKRISWLPGNYDQVGRPIPNSKANTANKLRTDLSGKRDYARDVWAKGKYGDSFQQQERDYVNSNMTADHDMMQASIGVRDLTAQGIRDTQKKLKKLGRDYNKSDNKADKYATEIEMGYEQDKLGRLSKTHKTAAGAVKSLLDKHKRVPECLIVNSKKNNLKEGVTVHDRYFNDEMVDEFLDSIGLDEIGMMALKWMSQDDLIEMLSANEYWIDEYFPEEYDESLKRKKSKRR